MGHLYNSVALAPSHASNVLRLGLSSQNGVSFALHRVFHTSIWNCSCCSKTESHSEAENMSNLHVFERANVENVI